MIIQHKESRLIFKRPASVTAVLIVKYILLLLQLMLSGCAFTYTLKDLANDRTYGDRIDRIFRAYKSSNGDIALCGSGYMADSRSRHDFGIIIPANKIYESIHTYNEYKYSYIPISRDALLPDCKAIDGSTGELRRFEKIDFITDDYSSRGRRMTRDSYGAYNFIIMRSETSAKCQYNRFYTVLNPDLKEQHDIAIQFVDKLPPILPQVAVSNSNENVNLIFPFGSIIGNSEKAYKDRDGNFLLCGSGRYSNGHLVDFGIIIPKEKLRRALADKYEYLFLTEDNIIQSCDIVDGNLGNMIGFEKIDLIVHNQCNTYQNLKYTLPGSIDFTLLTNNKAAPTCYDDYYRIAGFDFLGHHNIILDLEQKKQKGSPLIGVLAPLALVTDVVTFPLQVLYCIFGKNNPCGFSH